MTTPSAKRRATQVVACGTAGERVASPRNSGCGAPVRRSSSGKLDPGSSPGVNIGIAIDAYCPPFWT